jgi:glutamate dehydrogenase/leucine dehydrogenase
VWQEEQFCDELRRRMVAAQRDTTSFAEERGVTLRRAAYALALERVAGAVRLRGYV